MTFDLAVISLSAKGVQVAVRSTDDAHAFWLPRHHPAIVWSKPPEPGEPVTVRLPPWIVQKHGPLRELRHQVSMSFHQPPGLDPVRSQGAIPMAYDQNERPPQGRGALFINKQKQQPNHPDRRGDLTLPAGYVLTLANGTKLTLPAEAKLEVVGWLKDTKAGEKYLSLSAKPFQERRPEEQRQQPETQNAYAAAKGRQAPAGGPDFGGRDEIPFQMEWR